MLPVANGGYRHAPVAEHAPQPAPVDPFEAQTFATGVHAATCAASGGADSAVLPMVASCLGDEEAFSASRRSL